MINSSFAFGITGNIATGKSVIRRMLSNAGVFGIDADSVANRMLYPGGYAFQKVINTFGAGIQTPTGHISNKKLGQIVFSNAEALHQLEEIVHPMVIETIIKRVRTAQQPLVSIEAIKLIEAGLHTHCDQIWVSYASFNHQIKRLKQTRNLSEQEANIRISAQPPQCEKLSCADVIINTETTFKDTWLRAQSALNDTIHSRNINSPLHFKISKDCLATSVTALPVAQLESAWLELDGKNLANLYERLGMKMVHVLLKNEDILAFVIWDGWNFTGTLEEVYPLGFFESHPTWVFHAFENHAQINQTEFLLIADELVNNAEIHPEHFGYQQLPAQINYSAWQIAAQKAFANENSNHWQKVLAQPFELTARTRFNN